MTHEGVMAMPHRLCIACLTSSHVRLGVQVNKGSALCKEMDGLSDDPVVNHSHSY